MAHRPFHRALGETSLELKCLFFFGLALVLVISVSSLLYWQVTKEVVYQQNPNTGQLLVDQGLVVKHWEALQTEEDRDFLPFLKYLTDGLSQKKYDWRFIQPYETSEESAQPRDAFEEDLLERFGALTMEDAEGMDDPLYEDRLSLNGEEYQYYQPIWAERVCLYVCHQSTSAGPGFDPTGTGMGSFGGAGDPLNEGDLLGIVQIKLPNGPTRDAVSWYWSTLLAVSIITAFLAMIAFYVTIRYVIIRPLRHLRQVSDAISHGEIAMRADIHTGDEFEALGVAFNRMLGHLTTVQDEIREVNVNLDAKVDELAQLNMQLYEMNRIKSDFLATMSHELRTPLNSILGFSDVLGSIDALDDKQKRYVENIRKSGRMLLDMINNILDLAKIESGKMDVRASEFSIAAVVGAQCDMARPLTEKKNIDLVADVSDDLPAMHQDQARVQQILNNLLSNAIKFTPEGGRIRVRAERTDAGELFLRVTDTGVGIAEEDQQTIFEKFRQGQTAMPGGDAMTREHSGTGLGLSIVKELCRLLEGEVWVESELGTGSTFIVRIPWDLRLQPRPESSLTSGFEEMGKLPLEVARDRLPQPLPAGPTTPPPESDD